MFANLRSVALGLFLAGLHGVAGCSPDSPPAQSDPAPSNEIVVDTEITKTEIVGRAAYEAHCASCHATGLDWAPVTGNADEWADRSSLWQAVLFEHANKGYLDMPAKGGTTELDQRTVDAAAEYMLLITHPYMQRD